MSAVVSVSGAVLAPLSVDASSPPTIFTPVTVTVGTGSAAATYVGLSVYNLLTMAQFIYPTAGGVKNGNLSDYVTVVGANGAQVVLSEGEVDPGFGGKATTDIIATSRNGMAIAPTLIVPGDVNGGIGGRDISGVTGLVVGTASLAPAVANASAAPGLTVSGGTATPVHLTAAGVQQIGQVSQTDIFLSGTTPSTSTFTGAPLSAVVAAAGATAAVPLDSYVVATGSDGYGAVYSGGEIDPAVRGTPSALVAYSDGPANTVGGVAGALRTTAPTDSKGGRYISLLDNVRASTPNSDAVTRLFQGALARTPGAGGTGSWSALLDHGVSLTDVAQGILQTQEFSGDGGAALSNSGFVARLYASVLGRPAADTGPGNSWTGLLNGGTSKAAVLAGFTNTPEAILHSASVGGGVLPSA